MSDAVSDAESDSAAAAGSSRLKGLTEKMSVLLADSDANIIRTHQALLENKFDMDVTIALTRKELISTYREGYDILFVALNLPALDGIELTKVLRKLKVHGKIVGLIDEHDKEFDDDDVDLFIKAGLDFCLKKPLTEEKVKAILGNTKAE